MDADDPQPTETAGRPSPGPIVITPHDRSLVEWVATASMGDRIPEPWKWASSPFQSMILRLIDLRVIAAPPSGADRGDVVREAAVAARAWLDANPRDAENPLRIAEGEAPRSPE